MLLACGTQCHTLSVLFAATQNWIVASSGVPAVCNMLERHTLICNMVQKYTQSAVGTQQALCENTCWLYGVFAFDKTNANKNGLSKLLS